MFHNWIGTKRKTKICMAIILYKKEPNGASVYTEEFNLVQWFLKIPVHNIYRLDKISTLKNISSALTFLKMGTYTLDRCLTIPLFKKCCTQITLANKPVQQLNIGIGVKELLC